MKERLLPYLACPACGGVIRLLSIARRDGAEILEGDLDCESCARHYPVIRGVPRFASLDVIEADKAATAENFGFSWQHFTQTDERYAEQFLGWLTPVRPEFSKDKLVLEGGYGKGRDTRLSPARCARELIAGVLRAALGRAFAAHGHVQARHVISADL